MGNEQERIAREKKIGRQEFQREQERYRFERQQQSFVCFLLEQETLKLLQQELAIKKDGRDALDNEEEGPPCDKSPFNGYKPKLPTFSETKDNILDPYLHQQTKGNFQRSNY